MNNRRLELTNILNLDTLALVVQLSDLPIRVASTGITIKRRNLGGNYLCAC